MLPLSGKRLPQIRLSSVVFPLPLDPTIEIKSPLFTLKLKLSKCCNPVQGDDIIGYITRGRGVTVHRTDCKNVKDLLKDEGRIIECYWDTEKDTSYNVDITIFANDREGLLGDIINVISTSSAKLIAVSAKANKEKIATIEMTIEVKNVNDLTKTQRELGKIDSVYDVKRKK